MNREAVVLGTPVYTTFAGRLGGVDEQLIRDGPAAAAGAAGDVRIERKTSRPAERARRDPAVTAAGLFRLGPPTAGAEPPRRRRLSPAQAAGPVPKSPPSCRSGTGWQRPIDVVAAVALAWYAAFFFRFEDLAGLGERSARRRPLAVVAVQGRRVHRARASTRAVALHLAARRAPRRAAPASPRACSCVARAGAVPPIDRGGRPLPRGVIALDLVLHAARADRRPRRWPASIFERPRPGFLLPRARGARGRRGRGGRDDRARDGQEARAGLLADRAPRRRPAQAGHAAAGRAGARHDDRPRPSSCASSPPDEVVIAMPSAPSRACASDRRRLPAPRRAGARRCRA